MQLAAGLARQFRILRRLGAGGMGTVFLAEQIGVGSRPVALKVLSRHLLDDPDFLLRFQNEAASTGRIHHPNVVTIYESGQADDGTPYIAMEFLMGETLRDALKGRGALPVAECAEILQQTARGLTAAHKLRIIHRDLKPDNIFLTQGDEGKRVVKIVDFGIAKLRESGTQTQTGTILGTPAYMSSEQASGMRSDQLDLRSDIYSLGIVVYEMLTGRVPFHSDTPLGYIRMHFMEEPPPFRAAAPGLGVSPQVEAVVMKALAKDREQRYASALEFARDFASAASAPAPAEGLPAPQEVVSSPRAQAEEEWLAPGDVNPPSPFEAETPTEADAALPEAPAELAPPPTPLQTYSATLPTSDQPHSRAAEPRGFTRPTLPPVPRVLARRLINVAISVLVAAGIIWYLYRYIERDQAVDHNNQGNVLLRKGDLDAAIAEYRRAEGFNPELYEAHHNLGVAPWGKGDLDAAIAEYRKALTLKPEADDHYHLGNALHDKGDFDAAIAEYRKALDLELNDAGVHYGLGNSLLRKGDLDAAIAEYRKALNTRRVFGAVVPNPDEADLHHNLGLALLRQADLDAAIAECQEALTSKPDDADVHKLLGLALWSKGDHEAANAEYRKAQSLKPESAKAP